MQTNGEKKTNQSLMQLCQYESSNGINKKLHVRQFSLDKKRAKDENYYCCKHPCNDFGELGNKRTKHTLKVEKFSNRQSAKKLCLSHTNSVARASQWKWNWEWEWKSPSQVFRWYIFAACISCEKFHFESGKTTSSQHTHKIWHNAHKNISLLLKSNDYIVSN